MANRASYARRLTNAEKQVRRPVLALSAALTGCLLLLSAAAPQARAATGGRAPRLSVSFVAVGGEVDAAGVVGAGAPRGDGPRSRWQAALEQRVGSKWLTRATSGLRGHGHLSGFSLAWTTSSQRQTHTVRVEVISGLRVVTHSATHQVRATSSVSVQSTLRASSVHPAPQEVVSVTGTPGAPVVVVLAKGARAPAVGSAIIIDPFSRYPSGLFGVATAVSHTGDGSTTVTTKPGTIEDAYSSFDAHLDGNLEELADRGTPTGVAARAADISLGLFSTGFSCNGSVHPNITHNIDFHEVEVHAEVAIPSKSNGYAGPGVAFWIGGHPKLDLGVQFSGETTCQAKASISIPIPDTPLLLNVGPNFTLHASGAVGVNLEWAPIIFYGFTRFYHSPANNFDSFKNGGKTSFSGDASLSLSFALEVGLSLDDRAAGLYGSLGPDLTGTVTTQTAPARTCLKVDADVTGSLTANAKAFFGNYTFTIGQFASPSTQIYQGCNTSGSTGSGGSGGGGSSGSGGSGSGGGGSGSNNQVLGAGGGDTCLVLTSGSVDCWGSNAAGRLGDGSLTGPEECILGSERYPCSLKPTVVSSVSEATQIAIGDPQSCAVLISGSVDCWPELNNATPNAVAGVAGATQVAVGSAFACALLGSGEVECWGDNSLGQLGDGTLTQQASPALVLGIRDATQVVAGGEQACALLKGGQVDCWGGDLTGELGYTPSANGCSWACSPNPIPVPNMMDAVQISAGEGETCAVVSGGTIKCWGENVYGQLGAGDETSGPETCSAQYYGGYPCSATPVEVSGITDATTVSAGGQTVCATLSTGAVECWGFSEDGGLGDGGTTAAAVCKDQVGEPKLCATTPVRVSAITTATKVAASNAHACALLRSGGVDCWGWNVWGQLGDGSVEASDVPVSVAGIQ